MLRQAQVKAVLSVLCERLELPSQFEHMMVQIPDRPEADLRTNLASTAEFIRQQRQKGAVLVHCRKGLSRSASVVLHYLMMDYGQQLETGLARLRSVRPETDHNPGFLEQLRELDIRLRNKRRKRSFQAQRGAARHRTLNFSLYWR